MNEEQNVLVFRNACTRQNVRVSVLKIHTLISIPNSICSSIYNTFNLQMHFTSFILSKTETFNSRFAQSKNFLTLDPSTHTHTHIYNPAALQWSQTSPFGLIRINQDACSITKVFLHSYKKKKKHNYISSKSSTIVPFVINHHFSNHKNINISDERIQFKLSTI